jgi:hypothetical protein
MKDIIKHKKIYILVPILVISILLLSMGIIRTKSEEQAKSSQYLGSIYKGNYVWGGAMNLCWNELNENILKEKLQLNTDNKIALEMVETLNNPVFTKKDIDEKSY